MGQRGQAVTVMHPGCFIVVRDRGEIRALVPAPDEGPVGREGANDRILFLEDQVVESSVETSIHPEVPWMFHVKHPTSEVSFL